MGGARNEAGEVMGTMESVGEEEDGRSPAGKGPKVFNGKYNAFSELIIASALP